MHGMRRAYQTLLRTYLDAFPCVALIGVRQCGKTTLLQTLPSSWKRYDLERRADFQVVSRDPDTFFRLNPQRVAIDEAQVLPEIFQALRVAIDARRSQRGRFVITGSSTPALLRSVSESLAGRIGIIEMAPFSWEEITKTTTRESFLQRLPDRKASPEALLADLKPRGSLALAHEYWFWGGYPEPWLQSSENFRAQWVDQYIQTYLFRDVKRLFPGLDDLRFRRFLELLGGLSGRIINYADVARALNVSQPTARDYFDIVQGTFLWRSIPAWAKSTLKRTVKHPRGYLRDTGLLHALLRIPEPDALLSHPQMGASWEGMAAEEVLRQLNAHGQSCESGYYRSSGGAEVDLVLEGNFGLLAIEIRHTSTVRPRELRALRDFVADHKARIGVVINNDVVPRLYDERLIGLPFVFL